MKNLLKFMGVIVVLFVWIELVDLSFYLMDSSDIYIFYGGFLFLMLITVGPILYFGHNIVMFLKNMRGVFFDKEKKE